MMLKPYQISNPNSYRYVLRRKPTIVDHGQGSCSSTSIFGIGLSSWPREQRKAARIRFIKAVASSAANYHEKYSSNKNTTDKSRSETIAVKAVVTVQPTVTGFFKSLGIDRGLDDIQDLLGKSLLLQLVSAKLDPGT